MEASCPLLSPEAPLVKLFVEASAFEMSSKTAGVLTVGAPVSDVSDEVTGELLSLSMTSEMVRSA